MPQRPLSVTIISCIFIGAGVMGIAYHFPEFMRHPFQSDVVWVSLLRLLAIVCGVFMLRGNNWARWLAMVWLAYHAWIGALHSKQELLMHALLLAVIAFFLFRPGVRDFFRAG